MNHRETLEYLAGKGNEVQMMHLGLHRTQAMMQALGNPQDKYPAIHIAGTNGKGSVAAMSESILRRAGFVTGLYTSPHLVRVEERIRVSGQPISARSFASLATRIRQTETMLLENKTLDRPLTTFEFLTCTAFLHFAKAQVDIAVFEVGLGGKLDATNIIHPRVSVITGISLDHQNYLGRTLTKIAGEKAGIIKPGVPAISGCSTPAPRRVICRQAKLVGAPLLESFQACTIRNKREIHGHFSFDLRTPRRQYKNLRLSLAGEHQTRNATLAVLAIEALNSFPITMKDIREGLAHTGWEGRLDEYQARRRTLLDGAHNPEGAQLLRDFLVREKEKEVHLVFGVVRDKNIRGIGGAIFPAATSIHLTPLVNTRSSKPEEVAAMHKHFAPRMRIHSNMREALRAAWKECSPAGLVVVTGSLYLVGELLPFVQANSKPKRS
ncbi:MAG TPA: folylpolyglutamate synthase/dihydrofolate synthase family protein [Acidobacteriota bacterium]|nr:folylpolyglutamate synthase/dihydrofolate synthase family protein [Acidobacteriota bacterium]